VGDLIGPFKVEAYTGTNVGDFMPGGCNNVIGTCAAPAADADIAYELRSYRLAGPTQYVTVTAPTDTQSVPVGGEAFVEFGLRNRLSHTAQTLTLRAGTAPGVTAGFHTGTPAAGASAPASTSVDLAAKADTNVHLVLAGTEAGATGVVQVTVETDQGGWQVLEIPYTVGAASSTTAGHSTGSTSRPAAGLPLAAVAVALALLARRSR
jgi:hypothetical protein